MRQHWTSGDKMRRSSAKSGWITSPTTKSSAATTTKAAEVVEVTGWSGVNFINVLRAAFMRPHPNSTKRYWRLNWNFTLSGSACVKAVLRMLMKLSPGVNFYLWYFIKYFLMLPHLQDKNTFFKCYEIFFTKKKENWANSTFLSYNLYLWFNMSNP